MSVILEKKRLGLRRVGVVNGRLQARWQAVVFRHGHKGSHRGSVGFDGHGHVADGRVAVDHVAEEKQQV